MGTRGCVWVGEIFSSHDKWQIKKKCNHKIRVQEHNGGGATSHQWHHVMSCDIISMIGGGVCHTGGVCHGKLPVWNIGPILQCYCHHPSHFNSKSKSMYSYLFFSLFEASRSDYNAQNTYLKTFLLADDGVHHHDITQSWPVPSLIFKFDIRGWQDGTRCPPSARPRDGPPSQPHSLHLT